MTNPDGGRGRGGRHHRRRGGRKGRSRGGRGRGGREGGRGSSPPPPKKRGDAAKPKTNSGQGKVAREKIFAENRSPQDPKPSTPSESSIKNVDDLKKVLGVGVDKKLAESSKGDTNNAGAPTVAPSGADEAQSEKMTMQQKLKEVRYCMRGDKLCVALLLFTLVIASDLIEYTHCT